MSQNSETMRQKIFNMKKENITFEDLIEEGIPFYKILHMLRIFYTKTGNEFYRNTYLEHACYKSFDESSYLIIGDTHIGSKSEEKFYLLKALEEAKRRGIKTVFHGGDIGDGMIDPADICTNHKQQVNHIVSVFPQIKGLDYYMIIGNHDKKYRDASIELGEVLEQERSDIHILGEMIGYIDILSHQVSIEHGIDSVSYYHFWYPEAQMRFCAHEHRIELNAPITKVPSLCRNDVLDFRNTGRAYYPGYLILNIEKEYNYDLFCLEGYQFIKGEAVKTKDKSLYMKK